jgi:hypothetical protein
MKKCDEMREPKSCLNKATSNEPIFVLRGKDPVGAATVRHWATMADGIHESEKIEEALRLANQMDKWRTTLATPQAVKDSENE